MKDWRFATTLVLFASAALLALRLPTPITGYLVVLTAGMVAGSMAEGRVLFGAVLFLAVYFFYDVLYNWQWYP